MHKQFDYLSSVFSLAWKYADFTKTYAQISRAASLLYTSASFQHFVLKLFGVMRKPQFHTTSSDGSASSKF